MQLTAARIELLGNHIRGAMSFMKFHVTNKLENARKELQMLGEEPSTSDEMLPRRWARYP